MTEQINLHKTIDLWVALTAIAVVGSTLAGAGWVAGRTYLQDEMSQYKESEKWKIPDAIRKITLLSDKLNNKLDSIQDYESLKKYKVDSIKEIKTLKETQITLTKSHKIELADLLKQQDHYASEFADKIKLLNVRIASTDQQNANLKEIIKGLSGEVVMVKVGQAQSVGHKSIRVGVSRSSAIGNDASVTSGDFVDTMMEVGNNFSRIVDGKKYVITLVKINESSCGFSFDVFENQTPKSVTMNK